MAAHISTHYWIYTSDASEQCCKKWAESVCLSVLLAEVSDISWANF